MCVRCPTPRPTPTPHGLQLTADERQFLDASTDTRRQFEAADRAIGEAAVWGLAAGGKAATATTAAVSAGRR